MAIVSGYQKMKDYIKQSSGYKLLSRWANANTLECDDGKTLQNKVGGISGISSSLTANSTTQAASTNLTNQLYQNMNQLSSDLGGLSFGKTTEGEWGYKPEGADSVIPFKSAVLSGANIYNQLWASGGNGSHLNATRYTFAEDYSSVFVVQSSSGIMGYGSESGIAYSGDGTVISLFSKRQSIGTDSSQSYYVDYIENPKTGDTLTFGQATGAQNRAVK